MLQRLKYCALILLAILVQRGHAVTNEDGAKILNRLDSQFVKLDSLIFPPRVTYEYDVDARYQPLEENFATDEAFNSAVDARVKAEIDEFKALTGVQLTGQAYYRFDGLMNEDDDEPVSAYSGKIQAEARWYFLQSALMHRKGNIREREIKGEIDRTAHLKERRGISQYGQKDYFRHINDSLLSGVLQHRIANLELLQEANIYLLQNEAVSTDQLLNVLSEKAEAERQLATLQPGAPMSVDLSGIDAYVVTVDTAALIKYITNTDVDLKLLELRLQLLDQQAQNISVFDDMRIAPFVRYSYYIRDYGRNTGNLDAGVSFTIPINGQARKQKKVLYAQGTVLEADREQLMRNAIEKVDYYSREIDRLNRASYGEVERMERLKEYLHLRAKAYNNRQGEFNRLSRMKEYNSYLVSLEKLIGFQYQRDCYIADLQMLLSAGSILQFCQEIRIPADDGSDGELLKLIRK